jgi:hypothetical protein
MIPFGKNIKVSLGSTHFILFLMFPWLTANQTSFLLFNKDTLLTYLGFLGKLYEIPLSLMVTVSLPYIVVKVFKSNCFLRCLEKNKMKIFAKIWPITTSHYSFDA